MHERMAKFVYRAAARARGESTFRFLETFRKTQWSSMWDWERYRELHLDGLHRYVASAIPFYRNRAGIGFRDLPILDRKQLKEAGRQLVNPSMLRGITTKKTSGSTGEPVAVLRDSEGLAREQAVTWRGYEWAGVTPGARQARFWGVPLAWKPRLIMRCKDIALNRKRFSVFNYSEEMLQAYAVKLMDFKPSFIYGYVSALNDFARFLHSRGQPIRVPGLKAVIATSEVLTAEIRERIETGFGVPVFNEYGCSELGTIAHECSEGRLHVNSETLHLEVVGEDGEIREEGQGRILVTEYHNRVQPLVRYDLGDVAELEKGTCACGRNMPVIREIHGKSYDIIFGPSGRKYFPEFFSYIFKDIQGHSDRIRQFQVIQTDKELQVNIVKGGDYAADLEQVFREKVRQEFGDFFTCNFTYMDRIPREKSGKFRQVKRIQPAEPYPIA